MKWQEKNYTRQKEMPKLSKKKSLLMVEALNSNKSGTIRHSVAGERELLLSI